ncbi:MAG: hypothetical protein A2168_05295 [Planctomycetes bacterium RBG_13_50_24]|nr:MAG: hypothetical protein A2168_05295 [Planctomycetes bacterium RBG_13_50_24]
MKRKMLRLGLMLIVIGFCSSGALATTMGPPVAGLDAGQFSIGLDYSTNDIGVDIDGKETSLYGMKIYLGDEKTADKEVTEGPEKFKLSDEIDSDMVFANLGYGVSDKLEVFLRLGAADIDMIDMDGGDDFAYGFGAKATFYEEGKVKLGALFQMTWASADGDLDAEDVHIRDEKEGIDEVLEDVPGTWDIDYYQLKFAVGPTYELTEGCSIYGGPFYHLVSGDLERKYSYVDTYDAGVFSVEERYSQKMSGDIEESSSFGVYIGAQVDLAANLPIAVEYQLTGDTDVIGASLVYRF